MFVGQAPSRTSDPARPLAGDPIAARMAALLGCSRGVYLSRRYARVNLLDEWPGRGPGKGSAWLAGFASLAARQLAWRIAKPGGPRRVVLLGRAVATAFGIAPHDLPYCTWVLWPLPGRVVPLAILPHPSGIVTWWNDPAHVRRAKRCLRDARS